MRIALALLSLTATLSCLADSKTFNLLEIGHMGGKGRIQDQKYHPNDPQVIAILSMGKGAVPILLESLESERPYDKPPIDFWPHMVEGDMALIVLSDLFLDPTWRQSTLPELCWDNLLRRTSREATASELLHDFVEAHGRAELARRWREAWAQYEPKVRWDSAGQYFRVEGRELTACAPKAG
jgi:hypothetical protein